MMQWTVVKAALAGIGILILGQILFIGVLLRVREHELLRYVLVTLPILAAFVAVYLAPRLKLVVGISMAIFEASLSMLFAFGYEYFGLHIDHIAGPLATFSILLVYNSVLCFVGGVTGYLFSHRRPIDQKGDVEKHDYD